MFLPIITAVVTLGGSFDLTEMAPRQIIFNVTSEQKMIIENTHTKISYKLIESAADVNDFLKVQGELALKMKKFSFDGSVSGSYLKERVDRTKTVELLIHMHFENYTLTFPSYIDPEPDWETRTHTGTHYVRSIVYGGELVVSYKMVAREASDLDDIRAAVKESLKTSSGSVNQEFKGKLNKIDKTVKKWSKIDITAFYTGAKVAEDMQLTNLDGVFKLIQDYPQMHRTPSPIRFELESLNTLKPNLIKGQVINRKVFNQILEEANNKYEDTTVAMSMIKKLLSKHYLTDEQKEKRNLIYERVHAACSALEDAISKLDMSKVFDPHIFDDAFDKYNESGYDVPNRFTREITEFINTMNNYVQPWYSYSVDAVAEYTRWGAQNCSLPGPDPLFVGFAMGAPPGVGSGSDVLCVPPDPDLLEEAATPEKTAAIAELAYQTTGDKPERGTLICSRCELENATSVFTVSAAKSCPEGTKLEYRGFLATGTRTVTDPICIDGEPHKRHPEYKDFGAEDSPHVSFISPVWMKCSEECRKTMNYVPCVVCSR